MLESPDLVSYNKLEYLEREIKELAEEENHLKWLKRLSQDEREWLIRQDFDRLLKLNTQTQIQARNYVRRYYVEIRNNLESIDPEDMDMRKRYGEDKEERREA